MRIEFLHSAREAFQWTGEQLRIGSAADNELVLSAAQAQAHHLRLAQDRRGWVLQVLPAASRVYVNARPVRERALLRPGDTLSVGDCRMLLRADVSPEQRDVPTVRVRGAVALRALAGGLGGRVLPVGDGLELGPVGRYPLELSQGGVATVTIGWQGERPVLAMGLNTTTYPLRVNGSPVQRALLQGGDQISLGHHRFVFDAPATELELPASAAPVIAAAPVQPTGTRSEIGWLIATAAVLALVIALLLWFRF